MLSCCTNLTETHYAIEGSVRLDHFTHIFDGLFHLIGTVLVEEAKVRRRIYALQARTRFAVAWCLQVVKRPSWWQICPEGA